MSSEEFAPVFITGMSGAGLSSAGRVLEDMGWYVVHNLPPEIIKTFIDLARGEGSQTQRVAIVSDVRSREFHGSIIQVMHELKEQGTNPILLFMEARDDVLIKRFDTVRRTHPLQGSGTLQTGIDREREMLFPLKESADLVLDTSEMSIHDLRRAVEESFSSIASVREHVTIQSFGFKHGAPRDADLLVDMRFLPNPYWVTELRPFRGTDKPVSDYVLAQPGAQEFLDSFVTMFSTMIDGYCREGKRFISIAVGCTGGHHRSVAIAEELGHRLAALSDIEVSVSHRDISRG